MVRRISGSKRLGFAGLCVSAVVCTVGCVLPKDNSSGDGGAEAGSGEAGAGVDAASASLGKECSTEPQSGLVLCGELPACPGVGIERSTNPDCGLSPKIGGAFDIVCVCNGFVCPLGVPTTCSEARQLIANQTEYQVCAQVGDGRCVKLPGGSTSPAAGGSCDQDCMKRCGYTPGCKELCFC